MMVVVGRHRETFVLLTSLSSSPLISSSSSLAEKIFFPQARQRVLRKYASVCSESRLLRSCSLSTHSINFRSHAVHKGNDGREIHGTQDSSGHVQVNHLDSAPVTGRNVSSHFGEPREKFAAQVTYAHVHLYYIGLRTSHWTQHIKPLAKRS